MLVRPHTLFKSALTRGFALGAFNVSNLEAVQAVIWGAASERAPVIVQTSSGAIEYAGLAVLSRMVHILADEAEVPVVLHLDHGKDFSLVQRCIEAGYTSVMIDASASALEENISITKQVVEYAHARSVWVEAEVGAILGQEGAFALSGKPAPDSSLTVPQDAVRFVEATGIDALAVSVGTIHGAFSGQEYIRFELLEELERLLPGLPLVVHGASGIASVALTRVARTNVCKINIDTELRIAIDQALRAYLAAPHEKLDPRAVFGSAREAMQAVIAEKMRIFGASGKARV